jgi:hypothetical protein
MKFSNFLYKPGRAGIEVGTVDVTTGWGPFRRTRRREVFKEGQSPQWRFFDSGKGAPGSELEGLAEQARQARATIEERPDESLPTSGADASAGIIGPAGHA